MAEGGAEALAVRMAHLAHEQRLKSVGLLFGIGAVLLLVVMVATLLPGPVVGPEAARPVAGVVATAGLLGLVAALLGTVAWGYRTLAPWVKPVGTAVSVLGLFGFPVGTVLHGWILYLVWCGKGRRILTVDYGGIIRATPEVRYKRHVGDWIVFAVLLFLVLGLAAMLLAA